MSRSVARLALLALACGAPVALAEAPSSASFVLSQATTGSSGGASSSASFRADGTLSQPATVGESTSASLRLQAGFWTSRSLVQAVDLALTLTDSQDPLPGGVNLIYDFAVENLGPGPASGVVVTGALPAGTTLVATSGCEEDPVGVPTCTLGYLGVGAVTGYTLEVSIDPEPPASITHTASVAALETDVVGDNDTASETTTLDDEPPTVLHVDTLETTADGELTDCETVHGRRVRSLRVRFSEPMVDSGGGSTLGDITHPASWTLVAAGANAQLETTGCGAPGGDDEAVAFATITYEPGSATAILTLAAGRHLEAALHRLFACGSGASVLRDLAGNVLDGDTDDGAGGDFLRAFRADPDNRFANGHFDCDLAEWVPLAVHPDEIFHTTDDADGSVDSGSAAVVNMTASPAFALGQCLPVEPNARYELTARLRLATAGLGIGVRLGCEFFAADGCSGEILEDSGFTLSLVPDTDGEWVTFDRELAAPAAAVAGLCAVDWLTASGASFAARLDHVYLTAGPFFADGFESGDASGWSHVVP